MSKTRKASSQLVTYKGYEAEKKYLENEGKYFFYMSFALMSTI